MITTWALMAACVLQADAVSSKFIASGATARAGGYRPVRAEMDGTAELVKKAPEGLEAPKYGKLTLGDKSWVFILDEPDGKPARLFIDSDGDGDLTNDPKTNWTPSTTGGLTMHRGDGQVDLGGGKLGGLGLYRFDPKDTRRAQLKNTLMFYTDFGHEITVNLDGKSYTSFVSGFPDVTSSLWIDRDGNKRTSYKREMVRIGAPFNFTGTTYIIKIAGNELSLETSAEAVPLTPLPPDLSIGKKAIPFEMVATDGTKIDFPKTYAGKLVMLDFWATWCGPCIAELPNVTAAYETWHDKGFDVLGISFDNEGMADKLAAFTKQHDMPWRQLYEGKQWNTTLGELYDVSAIPFVLLVDGDTGEILATAAQLRGPGLTDFIGKALEKKQANAK